MAYYYSPFRKVYKGIVKKKRKTACPFCDTKAIASQAIKRGRSIFENESYYWIVNLYPKFEGHTMVVPKRHVTALGEETPKEVADREALIVEATRVLRKVFPKAGFEIFLQTGDGSESSVPHLHWHVVPASPKDPLRSFDKLGQFYTVEPGKERVLIFPVKIQRSPKQLISALSRAAARRS